MTTTKGTKIERPNGNLYRPRGVAACAVSDDDGNLGGVVVFGTHDIDRARALACDYVAWQLDDRYVAVDPRLVWWSDRFEYGARRWVDDDEHGRAGVWFREIVERTA